jgi:hypothetical protein
MASFGTRRRFKRRKVRLTPRSPNSRSHRLSLGLLEPRMLLDGAPPRILSVSPLPPDGTTDMRVVDHLTVQTSEDLQPGPVNLPSSWELLGAGADGLFETPDDQLYALTANPAYTSGTAISLVMPNVPLQVGQYRFTAFASALKDLDGNALDGDGDETGGDDYVRTFGISTASGFVLESTNNDTLVTATALPLVEDPGGSGYWVGHGLGSIQPSSDVDYWSFEALAGDVVSIAMDTPASGLNAYMELRNAADGNLVSADNEGPETDAFISHYTIVSSGTYYVRAWSPWAGTTGSYELRVDVARGI